MPQDINKIKQEILNKIDSQTERIETLIGSMKKLSDENGALKNKLDVCNNLIDYKKIISKSEEKVEFSKGKDRRRFIYHKNLQWCR